jgi:hypothetical protein
LFGRGFGRRSGSSDVEPVPFVFGSAIEIASPESTTTSRIPFSRAHFAAS